MSHAPRKRGATSAPLPVQAPHVRLPAVLINLAGLARLVDATVEPWTDAPQRRAILMRLFVTFMLATADPLALVTACLDVT